MVLQHFEGVRLAGSIVVTPDNFMVARRNKLRRWILGAAAIVRLRAACLASEFSCVPSARQLAWSAHEFTVFIHFGMNTFSALEWGEETEDPRYFNPRRLDARQWVVDLYSTDPLGSTRFRTGFDPGSASAVNGQLGETTAQTFNYDAYGQLVGGNPTDTEYVFTRGEWDNDVGAYYPGARWYRPNWGRLLSRDSYEAPEEEPISQNRFLHSEADPTTYIDPFGNEYTAGGALASNGANNQAESNVKPATTRIGLQGLRKAACLATYGVVGAVTAGLRLAELQDSGGHHGWPKMYGGNRYQHLARIAAELHTLFQKFSPKYAQADSDFKESNTYSESRKLREEEFRVNHTFIVRVYRTHLKATDTIERICRDRGARSFRRLTEPAWNSSLDDIQRKFN